MAIHQHLTEFAGLPVVDYTPDYVDDRDARVRAALADPEYFRYGYPAVTE